MRKSSKSSFDGLLRLSLPLIFLIFAAACSLEPPPKKLQDKQIKISGGGITLEINSLSGRYGKIVEEKSGYDILRPWPESDQAAGFGVRIEDELEGWTLSDLEDTVAVRNFEGKDNSVRFDKIFIRSGYQLQQEIFGDRQGIHFKFLATPAGDEAPLRSVRFSYLLPLPRGFYFWAPDGGAPRLLDGTFEKRLIYGLGGEGVRGIAIPLISVFKPGGPSFSLAVPLEISAVRVIFSIEPSLLPEGVSASRGECDWLRITFDLAGAGGGRSLETGLWLYAHPDDWRPALRQFAEKYREYFDPVRRTAGGEGILSRIEPPQVNTAFLTNLQRREIRLARLSWNFFRSGEWVPPQAVRFDDFTWTSQADTAYPSISVALVRSAIDNLLQFKLRPVLQATFNGSCGAEVADNRFADDLALDERKKPRTGEEGEMLMYAGPSSPFGLAMIENQRRMLELYPQAEGYFFTDWASTGLDFGHDDSLTVIHGRPAYRLAANRLGVGRTLVTLVNQAKKMVIASTPSNVAECRGLDAICITSPDAGALSRVAYLGLWRPLLADTDARERLSHVEAEEWLKEELIQGVIPADLELGEEATLARAYRPLFLSLRGREWLLEPHVLETSTGLLGQAFSIPAEARSGEQDVLVCLVQPGLRLGEEVQRSGMRVRLRLPASTEYVRAVWTPAARNAWPVPVNIVREGEEDEQQLTIALPPFGPAGVLRLSRR